MFAKSFLNNVHRAQLGLTTTRGTFQRSMTQQNWFVQWSRATFTSKLFVQNIPVDWDVHELDQRFSIVGPINYVYLVKDKMGQPAGKAIIEYQSSQAVQDAIQKFDNRAVENLVCRVKPYFEEKS